MKLITLFLLLCMASTLWALDCYIIAEKSSDWNNFNVNIQMFTSSDVEKSVLQFDFPKTSEKNKLKKAFDCNKIQNFYFQATYTPAIWHSQDGKPIENTFKSKKTYNLAAQYRELQAEAKKDKKDLNITIKFPDDFPVIESPSTLGN